MKNLWVFGLILILIGSLVNGLLIQEGITGLPREAMRLVNLVGIGLLVYGLILKFRSKK